MNNIVQYIDDLENKLVEILSNYFGRLDSNDVLDLSKEVRCIKDVESYKKTIFYKGEFYKIDTIFMPQMDGSNSFKFAMWNENRIKMIFNLVDLFRHFELKSRADVRREKIKLLLNNVQ